MSCTTHHDACDCRMEIVRELAKLVEDSMLYCTDCTWFGENPPRCVACDERLDVLDRAREAGLIE